MKLDKRGFPVPCEARPLPWLLGESRGIRDAKGRGVTANLAFLALGDAKYAIHAANCFPVLVEALVQAEMLLAPFVTPAEKRPASVDPLMDDPNLWLNVFNDATYDKIKAALEAAKGAPNDQQD